MNEDTSDGKSISKQLLPQSTSPFTLYDIFGYLVPAIVFISLAVAFEQWGHTVGKESFRTGALPLLQAAAPTQGANWLSYIVFLVTVASPLYALGHIISSLSSLIVDRIVIVRGFGYPYEHLLKLNTDIPEVTKCSRFCIQSLCVVVLFCVLLSYIKYFFEISEIIVIFSNYTRLPSQYSADMGKYVGYFGTLLVRLSFGVLLLNILIGIVYGVMRNKDAKAPSFLIFVKCVRFVTMPRFCAHALSKLTHHRVKFSDNFIRIHSSAMNELFGLNYKTEHTNNYWMPNMYVLEHSPKMYAMLTNWHHLYSFSRNLATALLLNFICATIVLVRNNDLINSTTAFERDLFLLKLLPLMYLVAGLVMVFRYYYLYSGYYTKFLLRAFLYCYSVSISSDRRINM